jgi:23S rRNA (cytosine1962-C5)-methyltransferase
MSLRSAIANPKLLENALWNANNARSSLAKKGITNAYRVFNAAGDGLPGLTIDQFSETMVISLYEELPPREEETLISEIARVLRPQCLYLKRRPQEARLKANTQRAEIAPTTPVWGEPIEHIKALENGLKFEIRPGGDLSVGLFLDMRDTRAWVRDHISNRSVLNCFSYTCGFGVAAHLGGAARVANLDLSRKVLDWGMQNYRLNLLEPKPFDFVSGDVFEWFKRFSRRQDRFDCIILDPPSFATSKHSRFSAASNYDDLVATAAELLEPDGLLIACCNQARLSRLEFKKAVTRGLERADKGYNLIKSLTQSKIDFPVPDELEAPLKVMIFEVS